MPISAGSTPTHENARLRRQMRGWLSGGREGYGRRYVVHMDDREGMEQRAERGGCGGRAPDAQDGEVVSLGGGALHHEHSAGAVGHLEARKLSKGEHAIVRNIPGILEMSVGRVDHCGIWICIWMRMH